MSYVDPDAEVPPPAPVIQGVEEAVHQGVVRENAMLKALPGVDLSTPLAAMFLEGYKGELTTDAIKAAAESVGVLAAPEPPAPAAPTADQLQEQATRDALAAGTPGVIPPATQQELDEQKDPIEEGWEQFNKARRSGLPREQASAQLVDRMVAGAVQGRPGSRVTYTPEAAATLARDF